MRVHCVLNYVDVANAHTGCNVHTKVKTMTRAVAGLIGLKPVSREGKMFAA